MGSILFFFVLLAWTEIQQIYSNAIALWENSEQYITIFYYLHVAECMCNNGFYFRNKYESMTVVQKKNPLYQGIII